MVVNSVVRRVLRSIKHGREALEDNRERSGHVRKAPAIFLGMTQNSTATIACVVNFLPYHALRG